MTRRLLVRLPVAIAASLLAAQTLAACFGFGDLSGGTDASDAAGSDVSAVDAASSTDAGSPTDSAADVSLQCPTGRGPAMVRVGNYCIDSTEVTQSQYEMFLAASGTPAQPPECAFNTTFVPGQQTSGFVCSASLFDPTGRPDSPVRCVDWCDALAFCKWAGKRLCGGAGGGAVALNDAFDPSKSEWTRACTRDGTKVYPYGASFTPGACWDMTDSDGGTDLPPVASAPSCIGGFPGIFDMSGSVREWENACSGASGESDTCNARGGSVTSFSPGLSCDPIDGAAAVDFPRSSMPGAGGFRCCGDLSPN